MPAKNGDPRATPERIVELLEVELRKVDKWTRNKRLSFAAASKQEALDVAALLKANGWKARLEQAVSLVTGKGFTAVVVTGPSTRKIHAR